MSLKNNKTMGLLGSRLDYNTIKMKCGKLYKIGSNFILET